MAAASLSLSLVLAVNLIVIFIIIIGVVPLSGQRKENARLL